MTIRVLVADDQAVVRAGLRVVRGSATDAVIDNAPRRSTVGGPVADHGEAPGQRPQRASGAAEVADRATGRSGPDLEELVQPVKRSLLEDLPGARPTTPQQLDSAELVARPLSWRYGQRSSTFTAPKSIRVPLSIVLPGGMFCEQTFQLISKTCWRPEPVASCEVVTVIAKSVRLWIWS